MNYELAKELKDAGFPLTCEAESPDCVCLDGGYIDKSYCTFPTLSELIKVCGEQFYELRTPRLNGEISSWQATAYCEIWRKGATPEEAVARLWLALNKK